MINFGATRSETALILAVTKRFEAIIGAQRVDRLSTLMDLEACHCNGTPLDLIALHECASDADLVHDVAGIARHIDRETGRLGGHFLPRYANRTNLEAA